MKEVQLVSLKKALAMLTAVGCKFAVIDPDGNKHGDLEIVQKTDRKRAAPAFKRGTLNDYFHPYVKDLKVGEVAEIPAGEYGVERIRGSVCSWFVRHRGKGSANTFVTKDTVQVMRIN